jgi:hypothetical protein
MTENVPLSGYLTTPQRKALEALASGATKGQASTIADRTERTINRWISEDDRFADALRASTNASVEDASRRLAALLEDAVTALYWLVKKQDTPDHVRLRAADTIISNLVRLREFDELEQRITALEEGLR